MKLLVGLVSARFAAAQQEDCYLPIDVMFLQDTTGSFEDDLPLVVRQIPDMVTAVLEQNPESYFGVAEFKDKPFYPLGKQDSDFCYKLNGALTGDVETFQDDYRKLYASGGGDLPESQYQALIDIAQDPSVGWRPIVADTRAGDGVGARVVIMSTDAPPHLPGDMALMHMFPTVPQGLPDNTGRISLPNVDDSCRNYEYPSADQMAAALRAQNIYLAILTPEWSNITGAWQWVNEELLNQPADFYQFIAENSSDLMGGVLKVLKSITETACATTTTSAAPVTASTATTPSTTTTTQPPATTTTQPPTTTTTQPPTTTTTQPPTTITTQPPTTTTTQPPTTTTTQPPTTTTTQPPTTTTTQPPTTPEDKTTSEESSPPNCYDPCPAHPEPCCFHPAMVIKVNNRPQRLVIDYEAATSS